MQNTINFPGLRNVEFIGFGNDIIAIVDPNLAGIPNLDTAYLPFKTQWLALGDYFAQQRGSLLSDDINRLDERRDKALLGISAVCDGYLRHFDAAKVGAAERILATMNKYGKSIHKQNLLAQTETVRNLVADFETDVLVKNALTLLDISDWVTEMKDANNAFHTTYLKRNEESIGKPEASLAYMRKPAIEAYRKFIKRLESLDELAPSATITKVMGLIDEQILKYNTLVNNRKKGGDKPTEGDAPAS